MRTALAGVLLFLRVFYLGVFGTAISVSSEVSSSSVPMCECPCGSGLTVSIQSVSSSYGSGNLKSYSYSVSAPSVSSSYGSGNLKSYSYSVSTPSVSSSYGSGNLKSYSYSVSAPSVSSSYGSGNLTSYSYSVSSTNKTQNYTTSSYYTSSSVTPVCYCPCGTSTSVVNAISSSLSPVTGDPSSLSPVTGDPVSSIQSTPSLTLYSSMSAVVSSPIHISASEISGSFGTTIIASSEVSSPSIPMCECPCGSGLTVSTQSVSSSYDSGNLTFYSYSVSAQNVSSSYSSGNLTAYSYSVSSINKTQNYTTSSYYTSSSVTPSGCYCPCGTSTSAVNAISVSGIQPTPSSVLNASTSAVVSSSINDFATEVPGPSQPHSTSPNVTPSTTESLSNSSIEHVLGSPSFSSHETMRTSSSSLHKRSSSSIETSRIATPSSVVDHISLCECPCDIGSTFLAETSSSVSDSGSLSSFTSSTFGQSSSAFAENSAKRSVYNSEGLSSFTSSVFGQISSALAETSKNSVYDSGNLLSFTSSTFGQSSSVLAENSRSVYDSEGLLSFTFSAFGQSSLVLAENSWSVSGSESTSSSASTGLMQDIPSVSGIRPSSSSSVGRKIVSSTIMYRMSSPPASSVCYCPCSTTTTTPSPSSAVVSPTPTPSVGLEENETRPEPRNASECEKQEAVQFSIPSRIEWNYDRDKSFKTKVATVASDFCNKNRTICGLKDSRRKRRSSHNVLYDYEKVHLLPGYPKNSSDPLQVAFYVLQPAFLFIGNCTALPRDVLVAIMKAHKLDIEKVIGANISGIEALFKPTTTTESPTGGPAEPADDSWKWIVIGVVIGVVVIILIGLLIFCLRKRKRDVKPITDPSQEDIAVQEGAKKENSLGFGSHSA